MSRCATGRYVLAKSIVGNHRVIKSTHIKVVPEAEITRQRQITFCDRLTRHLTTQNQRPVITMAIMRSWRLKIAT